MTQSRGVSVQIVCLRKIHVHYANPDYSSETS